MLFKKPTFYFAIIGTAATAVLASRMNTTQPMPAPPIQPPVNPYEASVAAVDWPEHFASNL